jgi:putative oxidoreductase
MKIGTLVLRGTIGGFFVGHGAQKLFGVAGGHGLKGTAELFEGLGLKPGIAQAAVAGVAETGGGLGLLLGYHTPLASSAVVGAMTTAIQRVHGKNGWNTQAGGYEYNAVLIAGALAIAEAGPGVLSLDALRGKQRSGIRWAAFALGAGLAGAAASSAASSYFGGSAVPEPAPVSEPVTVEEAESEAAGQPLPLEPLGN